MQPISNFTLNSFREIASSKGDAVVQINTGNDQKKTLSALAGKVKQVKTDSNTNWEVRQQFYNAIERSCEGTAMRQEALEQIKSALGLNKDKETAAPLTKIEIRTVLQDVDKRASATSLLLKLRTDLQARIGVSAHLHDLFCKGVDSVLSRGKGGTQTFPTPDSMSKLLPKGFRGLSKDQLKTFVKNNFAVLLTRIYENTYWEVAEGFANNTPELNFDPKEMVKEAVERLLNDYANGQDGLGQCHGMMKTPKDPGVFDQDPKEREKLEQEYQNCGLKELEDGLRRIATVKSGNVLSDCRLVNLCGNLVNGLHDVFLQIVKQNNGKGLQEYVDVRYGALKQQLKTFLDTLDAVKQADKGSDFGSVQRRMVNLLVDKLVRANQYADVEKWSGDTIGKALSDVLTSWNETYSAEGVIRKVCANHFNLDAETTKACCEEKASVLRGSNEYAKFLNDVFGSDPKNRKLEDFEPEKQEAASFRAETTAQTIVDDWKTARAKANAMLAANKEKFLEDLDQAAVTFAKEGAFKDIFNWKQMVTKIVSDPNFDPKTAKQDPWAVCQKAFGIALVGLYVFGREALQKEGIVNTSGLIMGNDLETLEQNTKIIKDKLLAKYQSDVNSIDMTKLTKLDNLNLLTHLRTNAFLRDLIVDGVVDVDKLSEADAKCLVALTDKCGKPNANYVIADFFKGSELECVEEFAKLKVLLEEQKPDMSRSGTYTQIKQMLNYFNGIKGSPDKTNDDKIKADKTAAQSVLGLVPSGPRPLSKDELPVFIRELSKGNCSLGTLAASSHGILSLFALLHFVTKNGGPFGLNEYCLRELGKPMDQVSFEDLLASEQKEKTGSKSADLKDTLLQKNEIAQVFAGKRRVSDVNWTTSDLVTLHTLLSDLEDQTFKEGNQTKVKFGGNDYTFTKLAQGEASVLTTVNVGTLFSSTNKDCPFRLAVQVKELRQLVDAALADRSSILLDPKLAKAERDTLTQALQKVIADAKFEADEYQSNILRRLLQGMGKGESVEFSGTTVENLRNLATSILNGTNPVNLKESGLNSQNSADAVRMHAMMAEDQRMAPGSVEKVVRLEKVGVEKSILERQRKADFGEVRNFVADLLSSLDTWDEDEALQSGNVPKSGDRVLRLIQRYAPEIRHLKKNPGMLDFITLPPDVGNGILTVVKSLLSQIDLPTSEDAALDTSRLEAAKIENQIDEAVTKAMTGLQKVVSDSFKPKEAAETDAWLQSFGELVGGEGIDLGTKQGQFANKILKAYFDKSETVDKRRMIAAVVRTTTADDKQEKVVGELLKGAGPLMQKLLQGLPEAAFTPAMRQALSDMKSRLPGIPEDAVKAQLYALVKSSKGQINSITVHKSLGAASVGQAFLCTIFTPEHPNLGVPCVVKLLRPSAPPAIRREKQVFDSILDSQQRKDFAAQYESILRELDFTVEAQNVDVGTRVYEHPLIQHEDEDSKHLVKSLNTDKLHSMSRLTVVSPTSNALVVGLAPGETLDGCIRRLKEELEESLIPETQERSPEMGHGVILKRSAVEKGGAVIESLEATNEASAIAIRSQLHDTRNTLLARYRAVDELLHVWFDQAVFGSGRFFHGDLHAGNVMADDNGLTVIDFGNCASISEADSKIMTDVVMAASAGNAKAFLAAVGYKEKTDKAFLENLSAVLKKGLYTDVLSRIQGALTLLQQKGFTTPPVLTSFFQSYTRLSNILMTIGHDIDRIETLAASLRTSYELPLGVKESIEKVGCFKDLDKLMTYLRGSQKDPYPENIDGNVSRQGDAKEIADQLLMLGQENALAMLNSFANRLKQPNISHISQSTKYLTKGTTHITELIGLTEQLFEQNEQYKANKKDDVGTVGDSTSDPLELQKKKIADAFEKLYTSVKGAASMSGSLMPNHWSRETMSSYQAASNNRPRPIGTIIGEVINNRQSKLLTVENGIKAAKNGLVTQLKDEINTGDDRLRDEADYIDFMKEYNPDHLSPLELKRIEGLVRDEFVFPPQVDNRFSNENFVGNDYQRKLFKQMLVSNLRKLEATFGTVENRHISYAFRLLSLRKSLAKQATYDPVAVGEQNFCACLHNMEINKYKELAEKVLNLAKDPEERELLRQALSVFNPRYEDQQVGNKGKVSEADGEEVDIGA